MEFNTMIPELTVFNIEETSTFYTNLGFVMEYERPEEKFIFLSYEGSQFMFEQLHEDGWNVGEMKYPLGQGINFSIQVSEIDALYDKVKQLHLPLYRELMNNTYRIGDLAFNQKEFLLQDPNGYMLRFTE